MKKTLAISTAMMMSLVVLACGGMDPEEEEYRSAVPTKTSLALSMPESQGGSATDDGIGTLTQKALGQRADLYKVTYEVSRKLNRSLWLGLNTIEDIVQHPPTSILNGVATWGPWTPALEPLTWMLAVTKKGPGQYTYALMARQKADKVGKFKVILAGSSTKGHSLVFSGFKGLYLANADNLHALDPVTYPSTGKLAATYDTTGLKRAVKLVLTNFAEKNSNQAVDAVYSYIDRANTSGEFRFALKADVHKNSSKDELFAVVSAWDKTGAGKGVAAVTGGDIKKGVTVKQTECWDTAFRRVFYKDNLNIHPAEGDPGKCAF